jgi:excisionase family DNA binding protein
MPVPKKKLLAPEPDRYGSRDSVAAMLGVSPQLVDKLLKSGRLPSRRLGRRILIRLRDVEAMLEEAKCN